mmetsp:Transcript_141376/g.451853  ORF Transcript_141376/g.451853 Transcript_141376/m.451853 type:complete len:219 (+) Transcript_141376:377-1033(+)
MRTSRPLAANCEASARAKEPLASSWAWRLEAEGQYCSKSPGPTSKKRLCQQADCASVPATERANHKDCALRFFSRHPVDRGSSSTPSRRQAVTRGSSSTTSREERLGHRLWRVSSSSASAFCSSFSSSSGSSSASSTASPATTASGTFRSSSSAGATGEGSDPGGSGILIGGTKSNRSRLTLNEMQPGSRIPGNAVTKDGLSSSAGASPNGSSGSCMS